MSLLDIRKLRTDKVRVIRFADHDTGGLGKVCDLRDSGPAQVDIISQGGQSLHIRFKDVDNFILALQKAKELWEDK